MRRTWGPFGVTLALTGAPGAAQSTTTETQTTIGGSTEGITVAAGQVRAFGEIRPGQRFFLEGVVSDRTTARSDAFGAAYPYQIQIGVSEGYLEHRFRDGRSTAGVRVGRYRTPFGIHDRADHAYNGFRRAPLVRWGYCHGISNYWTEGGVDLFASTPGFQFGISVGRPQEDTEKLDTRRAGWSLVTRAQSQQGSLIAGASYMQTETRSPEEGESGTGWYTGLDTRWMREGVQLRGEWIQGRPFPEARMGGWYLDALVHRPGLGSVVPVVRYEEYRFRMPGHRVTRKRWTAGARVRVSPSVQMQVNWLHQPELTRRRNHALDVGLTHTVRF